MHIPFSKLAVAASLLVASPLVHALADDGIPPDTPVSSLLSSAQAHLSRGETTEALLYYDAAIARDPSNYLTLFKRATTYLSLGRTNQATDDFNKVLSLQPGFEGAHVQLARIRLKLGDWEGARGHFADGGKAPESQEIQELEEAHGASKLGLAAEKEGDWEACANHLSDALSVAPRAAPLREARAHCRIELGNLESAVSDLQSLLHLSPGNITPHLQISAMLFYSLGETARGMEHTRKCLHSDPDSKACAKLLRKQKNVDKALTKAAKGLDGTRPLEAVKILVDSKDETGLVTDIEEQVEEMRTQGYIPAKGPVELHTRVIEMTCEGYYKMNSKKAPEFCNKAVQANENSFYGLLQQGKDRLESESFEAAIAAFEKAREARPDRDQIVRPLLEKAQKLLRQSRIKDYYKVLEVPRDADERQIKHAYRKASKKYHPDKAAQQGVTKEDAEKKMAAVNEAYEVLSDPELKARFDNGEDPMDPQGQSNPFQGNPFGGGGHPFFFQSGGGHGGRGGPGAGQKFQFNFNGF